MRKVIIRIFLVGLIGVVLIANGFGSRTYQYWTIMGSILFIVVNELF